MTSPGRDPHHTRHRAGERDGDAEIRADELLRREEALLAGARDDAAAPAPDLTAVPTPPPPPDAHHGPAGLGRPADGSAGPVDHRPGAGAGHRSAGAPVGDGVAAAEAVDLRKVYGSGDTAVVALDGVSATFPPGGFTAIMGPSGSGKSTFMHCLAGLDTATSGEVVVGGRPLAGMSDAQLTELRRDAVGFVFQQFNLLPTLTAEENITLPLQIAGRHADPAWFEQVVTAVGLVERLGHRPTELSGGQQQRVACARALITRPAVVFADEPTGNLDSRSSAEVLSFLRHSVTELGQTIVMVTHEPSAAAYADRVLFLADGRIVDELRDPDAGTVLDRMKHLDRAAGA